MGRIFTVELDGRVYHCRFCRTHLAIAEDLISRSFHSRHGKAYLFNYAHSITFEIVTSKNSVQEYKCSKPSCANISVGDEEERMLLSGLHTVADIFCCSCGQHVGWKYVATEEKSQKYKEGKYVLERGRIVDGTDLVFYVNTRSSGSDADESSL